MIEIQDYVSTDGFLESLCKARTYLKDSKLLTKLDEVISKEIAIANIAADKALNKLKQNDNIKAIK